MRNLKDIKARAFPRTAPERRADCFSVPLHRRALARVPESPRDCPRLPEITREWADEREGEVREYPRSERAPPRVNRLARAASGAGAESGAAARPHSWLPASGRGSGRGETHTHTHSAVCTALVPLVVTRCSESAPARGRTPTPPHEPPARPRDQQPCGDSAGGVAQPPGSSSSEIVIGHRGPPRAGGSCVHGTASPPSCRRPAFPRRRRTSPRETRRRTRDRSRPLTRLRRDRPRDHPMRAPPRRVLDTRPQAMMKLENKAMGRSPASTPGSLEAERGFAR